MVLKNFKSKSWKTPCGLLKGSSIIKFLKRLVKIVKAIISRCIFAIYCFVAVWRVTQALQNDLYWLLLFTLCPLGLETLHAITQRKTNQLKWLTPNVLFFLLCAVPCIWLLELKLLDDRINQSNLVSSEENNNSSLTQSVNNAVGINASDDEWTLALEQILIFSLVLAKWIAPKGNMSLDELSQLLLVFIAAGADILELMEAFNDDRVSDNTELVYIIMAAWSWSLLQFTIVLTASKTLPIHDDSHVEKIKAVEKKSNENGRVPVNSKGVDKVEKCLPNGKPSSSSVEPESSNEHRKKNKVGVEIIQITKDQTHTDDGMKKTKDQLRAKQEVAAFLEGRRCFDCFCCYNEIWGTAMSIFFQDGPFFIIRMVILLHYKVITQMSIFFVGKNILVISLVLNRIRVIFREDKKKWSEHMEKVQQKRFQKKNDARKALGLPLKAKQ